MSFHVGQQVVCVNDQFSSDKRWRQTVRNFPTLNTVYTIREIHSEGPLVGFCFYQIINPRTWFAAGIGEPAFNSRNFRPVKTTNIEVFEKLLVPRGENAARSGRCIGSRGLRSALRPRYSTSRR